MLFIWTNFTTGWAEDLLTNSGSYDWSWKWKKKWLYKSIPKLYHYTSEYNSYRVTMKSKLKMKPVPKGSEICIREIKTKILFHVWDERMLVLIYILYSVGVLWILYLISLSLCILEVQVAFDPLQYGEPCVAGLTNSMYLNENML